MSKQYYHYTDKYLLSPTHPVTINLIGAGGNGSQMLNCLARIHTALVRLGHPGFFVRTWDPDSVTDANLGRQLFATGDIGLHKAMVLTTRINRFYGLQWSAEAQRYEYAVDKRANITITCTDNIESRQKIYKTLVKPKAKLSYHHYEYKHSRYWLDLGNSKTTGQVILGTTEVIPAPKKHMKDHVGWLPSVMELFPGDGKKRKPKDDGPSCSLAEALEKQDLFINSTLVQFGANLIWKMFRQARIQHHGVFLNLETMALTPLKIKA